MQISASTMASGHHESHHGSYSQDAWINLNQYPPPTPHQSISPLHEYPGFEYGQQPLPLESSYAMPRPPPYATAHHQLPPPLVMPQNGVWPSMLASQTSYQTPILPANAISVPVSAAPSHGSDTTPTSAKSTSRRKLTDEERRQMCLEAEQNPTMKQTQIGAKFNVERSTVSKILRQKDKYMKPPPKEEVSSPGKKSKVKLPDVEKTLANWARNQQKKGAPVTDDELRKQAVMFSAGRNDQQTVSSATWLDMFKRKHLDGPTDFAAALADHALATSPISSNGLVSPPMSTVDDKPPALPPLLSKGDPYASSAVGEDYTTDLDPSEDPILSPISPDLDEHAGLAMTLGDEEALNFPFSRQRSQTFPHLPQATGLSHPVTTSRLPLPARSMTSQSIDTTVREISVDPRQMMKRHKSVPDIHNEELIGFASMQPPPLPHSADISPVSNPASPLVPDDNIRALHAIKHLLQQRPDVAEPDDYVMIGKLMEKMKLLRSPTGTPILLTGSIPGEVAESPRISKKRGIVGISS